MPSGAKQNQLRSALRIRRLRRSDLPADTLALARYLIGKTLVREVAAWPPCRTHRRDRSLSGRRRRGTRLRREDAQPPFLVSSSRARLRVFHLRLQFHDERFQRRARRGRGSPDPRARAARRHRVHGAQTPHETPARSNARPGTPGAGVSDRQAPQRAPSLVQRGNYGWAMRSAPPGPVGESVRIGINREVDRLYRFYERGNPFVSGLKRMRE